MNEIFRQPGLTLQNFSELSQQFFGQKRRFRVTPEQKIRIKQGLLTREQALAERIKEVTNNESSCVNG